MGMTQTDENKQLKRDAIKLRQDLGWSIDKISVHLNTPHTTIQDWVYGYSESKAYDNFTPALNKVNVMDCGEGGYNKRDN